MALNERQKKIVDAIQWLLIIVLLVACAAVFIGKKSHSKASDTVKEDTYIRIYDSKKISELEKQNKALHDSLVKETSKKPESAVEIRYKYKYIRDTITVTKFCVIDDSIYHYENDNDTIKEVVDIKAKDLEWYKSEVTINDKFTVINRNDGNENEMTIYHSPNVELTSVETWHRKRTFKERIGYGPTIGVGYGLLNKKIDMYVGISLTYSLGK